MRHVICQGQLLAARNFQLFCQLETLTRTKEWQPIGIKRLRMGSLALLNDVATDHESDPWESKSAFSLSDGFYFGWFNSPSTLPTPYAIFSFG